MAHMNSLSYWFPKLEAAGLPVPRTKILDMPEPAQRAVWAVFDGNPNDSALREFATQVAESASELGYPFFLRTDHTSGKHNWQETCFVASAEQIYGHLMSITEYSECCSLIGLPWSRWVVRELLPTIPFGVCSGYGNMPICREFRFFVHNEDVRCWHPYWPIDALLEGGAPANLDYQALCRMDDLAELSALASAAGRALRGSWSVDILETRRGWFITDMALGGSSYHSPGCVKAKLP